MSDGRVVSVSTVRATTSDLERLVGRNLGSGVDHMIVFLDRGEPGARKMLAEHPDVTVVPTDRGWWQANDPKHIERRQMINATLATAVATTVPSVARIVHLDLDEALSFDRASLDSCASEVVCFPALEVVSQREWPEGRPRYFKRVPTTTQLRAMAAVRAIDEPTLEAYYRGDVAGKAGVRPGLGVRLGLHRAYDEAGNELAPPQPAEGRVLRYGSSSLGDFIDGWRDYGPRRAARSSYPEKVRLVGLAVFSIINQPTLDEKARSRYLTELYDKRVADNVEALEWFGLLEPAPDGAAISPRRLPEAELAGMRALLRALRPVDKEAFALDAPVGSGAAALEAVSQALEPTDAARVRDVVARYRGARDGASA